MKNYNLLATAALAAALSAGCGKETFRVTPIQSTYRSDGTKYDPSNWRRRMRDLDRALGNYEPTTRQHSTGQRTTIRAADGLENIDAFKRELPPELAAATTYDNGTLRMDLSSVLPEGATGNLAYNRGEMTITGTQNGAPYTITVENTSQGCVIKATTNKEVTVLRTNIPCQAK